LQLICVLLTITQKKISIKPVNGQFLMGKFYRQPGYLPDINPAVPLNTIFNYQFELTGKVFLLAKSR